MATPFSLENQSTREEFLSGDFVEAQSLASAQLQDLLRDSGRGDEYRTNPTTPYVVGVGDTIDGATLLPTLTAAAGFNMTLGFGQIMGNLGLVPPTTLNVDDSSELVVRWDTQAVAFSTPDPVNPRIDIIYATPGTQQTDVESRNILLDPVARTIAPANVPKRLNPNATITYVAGTPGASPSAPTAPGTAVLLFEVFIPAAAASAANFLPARGVGRSLVYPMNTAHGILQGVRFTTDLPDETTTSANLFVGFTSSTGASKVVIDGEVLAFVNGDSFSAPLAMITQDAGGNNPFAGAAPATNDKPYYIYACGGRHLRQGRTGISGAGFFPIIFVESLVAPTEDGRPSAAITTPRGTTQAGALYVGVGWVVQNSTRRKSVSYAGDWVYARTSQMTSPAGQVLAAFNDTATRTAGAAITNHIVSSRPATSDRAIIGLTYANASPSLVNLGHVVGAFIMADISFIHVAGNTFLWQAQTYFEKGTTASMDIDSTVSHATASFQIFSRGYNMNVKRYTAGV